MKKSVFLDMFITLFFLLILISGCVSSKKEWIQATSINKVGAYDEYLSKYPDGEFADEAIKRRKGLKMELDWHSTQSKSNIKEYEEFLRIYPDSRYKSEALNELVFLKDWKNALSLNSINGYENFLSRHPNTKYSDKAHEGIDKLRIEKAWESAIAKDDINSYANFLNQYPGSEFTKKAHKRHKEIQEDMEWKKARSENTISTYRQFLSKYPHGLHSNDVTKRLKYIEQVTLKKTKKIRLRYSIESEWDKVDYDVIKVIKTKLVSAGFSILPQNAKNHDATFYIDYRETKGGDYILMGKGTNITCDVWLNQDQIGDIIYKKKFWGRTPSRVRMSGFSRSPLYQSAVEDFEDQPGFKFIVQSLQIALNQRPRLSPIIKELRSGKDFRTIKEAIKILNKANWKPKSISDRSLWSAANEEWNVCVSIGSAAVPSILRMLSYFPSKEGFISLGQIGDSSASIPITKIIQRKYMANDVKISAVETLGKIGDDWALKTLSNLLKKNDPNVMEAARKSIEAIKKRAN